MMNTKAISVAESKSPDENIFVDLNVEEISNQIILNNSSVVYLKVKGNHFGKWGIGNDDIIIVNRKFNFTGSHLTIIFINEESLIRRVKYIEGKVYLMPESTEVKPLEINEDEKVKFYGTIEYVIHKT